MVIEAILLVSLAISHCSILLVLIVASSSTRSRSVWTGDRGRFLTGGLNSVQRRERRRLARPSGHDLDHRSSCVIVAHPARRRLRGLPRGVRAARARSPSGQRVNVRNLAGVPSIVYGMLGLAIFVGWHRADSPVASTVISAALALSVLVLPIVIITTIGGPPCRTRRPIREGALRRRRARVGESSRPRAPGGGTRHPHRAPCSRSPEPLGEAAPSVSSGPSPASCRHRRDRTFTEPAVTGSVHDVAGGDLLRTPAAGRGLVRLSPLRPPWLLLVRDRSVIERHSTIWLRNRYERKW